MRRLACWCVLGMTLGWFMGQAECDAELRAGMGRRVITPDPLLPVSGGMGPTEPATKKAGELIASAMVLAQGETRVAIVSLDLLGFPSVLGDRIRQQVPEIPANQIMIGASHTHSAPDCYGFPDGKGGHSGSLEYMDFVCQQAAAALREAVQSLEPVSLRVASGEAAERIAYNYYAPDLYDRRVGVIQVISPKDRHVIGTLVNYAIHPEVLGSDLGIVSPDLIGPLRQRIEQEVGGVAMFMNGAQGGMITADNRDLSQPRDAVKGYWNDFRTWEECVRIGNLLANEALRVVRDAPEQADPILVCRSREVKFPVESETMWTVVTHSPLKYPHNADHSITARVNFVQLGNAQILTIPGEALPNIGMYLKRKMRGDHNFLFGLTNDAFGYILTKVDFQSFSRYDYVSRVSLGEMTGEILIEQSLDLLAPPKTEK